MCTILLFTVARYYLKWNQKTQSICEREYFIFRNSWFDKHDILYRERKPGSIDVHPHLDAILLSYELDVQILGSKETVIHGEKKVFI